MPKRIKPPNPGSPAALKLGCTCPVLDNRSGKGCADRTNIFWIDTNCPIHKPKQKRPK